MTAITGKLISIEGIDGTGKTTLARRLTHWIETELNLPVISLAEPGDPGNRDTLQSRTAELAIKSIKARTLAERQGNFLLFMANRVLLDYQAKLDCGFNLILDRYIDTSIAYHRGVDPTGNLTALLHNMLDLPKPELTLLLTCDVESAYLRQRRGAHHQEINPDQTLPRLVEAQGTYCELMGENPGRIYRIDANKQIDEVVAIAKTIVQKKFGWTTGATSTTRGLNDTARDECTADNSTAGFR